MVSIDCIERGVARYIDTEILPKISRDGAKGYVIGIAASLLIKRGGGILREHVNSPLLQQLGLVTADGAVDLDAIRDAAVANLPTGGLCIDLPMGIALRIGADDVAALHDYIRREASS